MANALTKRRGRLHGKYTNEELTDWFPASNPPVRRGVYKVRLAHKSYREKLWYQYWNGSGWCVGSNEIRIADRHRHMPVRFGLQRITHWRGIIKSVYDANFQAALDAASPPSWMKE